MTHSKPCVKLTDRYITDRFFPDKAIDAMDEVGSRVHLQFAKVPPEITELEKNIEDVKEKKQAAVSKQNFELAASYRDRQTELSRSRSCNRNGSRVMLKPDRL